MPRATWIADACRAAGLDVIEVEGWQTRGSESFNPGGVVCHHTAGARTGDMPSLRVLIYGRSDLPGPLCQVGLGRSGTVYVVAAGRANHAGSGSWERDGVRLVGNSSVFGIEAENAGGAGDPWPITQLVAYYKLAAVLEERTATVSSNHVCGHKEWAPSRKVDPHSLDMNTFRARVLDAMGDDEEEPLNEADKKWIKDTIDASVEAKFDKFIGEPYRTASGGTLKTNAILAETAPGGGSYEDGVKAIRRDVEEAKDAILEAIKAPTE